MAQFKCKPSLNTWQDLQIHFMSLWSETQKRCQSKFFASMSLTETRFEIKSPSLAIWDLNSVRGTLKLRSNCPHGDYTFSKKNNKLLFQFHISMLNKEEISKLLCILYRNHLWLIVMLAICRTITSNYDKSVWKLIYYTCKIRKKDFDSKDDKLIKDDYG